MDPELIELNLKARNEAADFPKKRFLYAELDRLMDDRAFLGLIGPRGVGKTILLKQLMISRGATFYISLDTIRLPDGLFPIAKELDEKGVKYLFVDEIHAQPGFKKDLKKIRDFLKIKIIFTSSCSLSLRDSVYDLSRRVRTINIMPLSFREFLFFRKDILLEPMNLDDLNNFEKSQEHYGKLIEYESLFDDYLKGGNYIFTQGETDVLPFFQNILTTILTKDIFYTEEISREEQFEIEKMLKFIGRSPAEDISYSSIASNTGITKFKSEKYVTVMEKAFVLNQVFPKGTNVTREPKILFTLPYRLLYKKFENCVGALREDFFVEMAKTLNLEVLYLKSMRGEKTPDYLVESTIFEIGGKSKGRSQFKGIKNKKKIILTHPGMIDEIRRPLFFFGMQKPDWGQGERI